MRISISGINWFPAKIYLFKVNNRNTKKRCEISSKLIIKTPERRQWGHCGVLIFNFEHISHLFLVFLLLTLTGLGLTTLLKLLPPLFSAFCCSLAIAVYRHATFSGKFRTFGIANIQLWIVFFFCCPFNVFSEVIVFLSRIKKAQWWQLNTKKQWDKMEHWPYKD